MTMQWGPIASNGYTICSNIYKVQVHSLGIVEHTGRSEPHG